MTDDEVRHILTKLAIMLLIGMFVQLGVIAYVFYSGYQGHKDLVASQRGGCNRGKLDRGANAKGWRIAQAARLEDGQLTVAAHYAGIAGGLEERGRIDCAKAYPKASIFP